jgi:hypothetical protein
MDMNTSWKPEVLVDGAWCSNALRFATKQEAEASVRELMSRWYVPSDGRAGESNDPVNYRFDVSNNLNIPL